MLKKTLLITNLIFIIALLSVGSCKKRSGESKKEPFDASIDGVAVRPLPQMDIELANRVIAEGPVSPTADVTDAEAVAAATRSDTSSSSATDELSSPGADSGGTSDYDYDEDYESSDLTEPNGL